MKRFYNEGPHVMFGDVDDNHELSETAPCTCVAVLDANSEADAVARVARLNEAIGWGAADLPTANVIKNQPIPGVL